MHNANYSKIGARGRPLGIANKWLFTLLAIVFIAVSVGIGVNSATPSNPQPQPQEDNEETDTIVARISLIEGSVSIQRGDETSEWFDAAVNTPIQTGDKVYTGDLGRTEIQFGSQMVRLNHQTSFDVLDLSNDRAQFRLYSGTATVRMRYRPPQPVEIDTPGAAVTMSTSGEYRINVASESEAEVLVRSGKAEVYNGNSVTIGAGQQLILNDGDYDIAGLPGRDEWDQWNARRDKQLITAEEVRTYVPESETIAGIEDLGQYGRWDYAAEYGRVWTPLWVSFGWAPYQDGRWMWRDPYGWTWVSYEPWGWAPYHYGRWIFYGQRWCWVPGKHRMYSPALVGFFSYGNGLYIGWIPLGPRDPFYPWWHGRRVHIFDGPIAYSNLRIPNAIRITSRDGMVTGKMDHYRGPALGIGRTVFIPPVVPTRASLAPGFGPPNRTGRTMPRNFNRGVVVKNDTAPIIRPFSDKQREIAVNGGVPVPHIKMNPDGRPTRVHIPYGGTKGRSGTGNQPPTGLVRHPGMAAPGAIKPLPTPPVVKVPPPPPPTIKRTPPSPPPVVKRPPFTPPTIKVPPPPPPEIKRPPSVPPTIKKTPPPVVRRPSPNPPAVRKDPPSTPPTVRKPPASPPTVKTPPAAPPAGRKPTSPPPKRPTTKSDSNKVSVQNKAGGF